MFVVFDVDLYKNRYEGYLVCRHGNTQHTIVHVRSNVFQLSSSFRVHSFDNEPNLLLQNATAVFVIVHPQAWLLIFLQVQRCASEWYLVCFSLVRMPALPQSYWKAVSSILLYGECDDPNSFFCEALFRFSLEQKEGIRL
ncbi:hypothetical protein AVEN_131482-1 [Araneus ventricosus]|uniref:Uncharacterized protein n=1 Tax=Araneus ventricosus TaxID=182803 RepID=A0A4Y2JG53_ARAVE|nr:hypothetical protein AVEN_131482-1 [Araneus ventricosus]